MFPGTSPVRSCFVLSFSFSSWHPFIHGCFFRGCGVAVPVKTTRNSSSIQRSTPVVIISRWEMPTTDQCTPLLNYEINSFIPSDRHCCIGYYLGSRGHVNTVVFVLNWRIEVHNRSFCFLTAPLSNIMDYATGSHFTRWRQNRTPNQEVVR